MDWPVYGRAHTRDTDPEENRYFKIEGEARYHYVDFPNRLLQEFHRRVINGVASSFPHEPEKQYEKAMDLKEEFNERLRELGIEFLTFVIVKKEAQRSYPQLGIQVRIDKEGFRHFLEEFSSSKERTLEEKYRYLFNSRESTLIIESKSERESKESIENRREDVKERVEEELKGIQREIDKVVSDIKEWQGDLQTYRKRVAWKHFGAYPSTLLYLMEMDSILRNIQSQVTKGFIPPSYREMRKLLENLSWAILDDFLFLNSDYYKYSRENQEKETLLPRPFHSFNKDWYSWDQRNRGRSNDFDQEIRSLRDTIFNHCQKSELRYDENYSIGKGEITVELKNRMSYPLFMTLSGIRLENKSEVPDSVYAFEFDELRPLIKRTIKHVLRGLKGGRRLGKLDRRFLDEAVESLEGDEAKFVVPPFPSNEDVINYIDTVWHRDLDRKLIDFYRQYSIFVHSYSHAWQVYPFSSVLEFKIFRNEIEEFLQSITSLIETYLGNCY